MMQSFFETAPHSLGDLLDASFRFFRLRFVKLLALAGVFAVARFVLSVIAGFFPNPWLILPLNLINGVLTIFLTLTLIVYVFTALSGRDLSIGEAVADAAGYFWPYLGMSILMGLALFGLLIPGSLIFGFAIAGLQAAVTGGSVLGYVLIILLALLLIGAPVLFLLTRWAVASQALVEENAGPTGGLSRSWQLTQGHFWRCVGYFLLVGLLSFIIVYLPAFVMGGALVLFPPALRMPVEIGINAVTVLLVALWTPFSITAMVMLYFDLRIRNEGLDVEMRVQQMEQAARAQAGQETPERPALPEWPDETA